jgi:Domain of unknown function (DUF4124)
MSRIGAIPCRDHAGTRLRGALLATAATLLAGLATPVADAQVYRWVDADGVIHLSSEKPPPGVKAERLDIKTGSKRPASTTGGSSSGRPTTASRSASPAEVAERDAVLGRLRNRECVIALEALERKTGGSEPTSAAEIKRLKQTADLNCSQDPSRRREQEQQALQLRMANSPSCVQARDRLADMLAPDAETPRDQLRTQQAFVEEHCTPPVR